MDWFTIQYSLDSVKQWCNGTLALMLADYLRDRHSTCTIHWWGYLVSHCMPNLLWERDKTRYICIYTYNWLSFMHGLPIFSSQAIILHRSRINCYTLNIQNTDETFHFFFYQISFNIEDFYNIPWSLFTIAERSIDVSIIYFLHKHSIIHKTWKAPEK